MSYFQVSSHFLTRLAFCLLVFEGGSNLDLLSVIMTLLVYPTQGQNPIHSWSHCSLVSLNTLSFTLAMESFQENCVTSTKGSQTKEQDTCQVRRETGEDVSFESRFILVFVVLK